MAQGHCTGKDHTSLIPGVRADVDLSVVDETCIHCDDVGVTGCRGVEVTLAEKRAERELLLLGRKGAVSGRRRKR